MCSCSISTTWRMRNMATCPTTHTHTDRRTDRQHTGTLCTRAGNGPQHGTVQTFLINFQAAKKQRQLGMPTDRCRGRQLRGQSAVRVDAKVNKNVNTPNVMLTRQRHTEREREKERKQSWNCRHNAHSNGAGQSSRLGTLA